MSYVYKRNPLDQALAPKAKYGENVAKVLQLAAWQKARKKELAEDV